ncbi:acetamidase [Sclerotinia borealis F-4128]|uniref:Acetamidase n=1 Tax=Sclerotinia borealis (strain F-4128) TaxID=1432307 RepID=W9CI97_SCLBF|nr:acetamidase [Sclerotinia borealis F-4128]
MAWEDIAREKRRERYSHLPDEWKICPVPPSRCVQDWPQTSGFFTPEELIITDSTASEVVRNIAERRWTAENVTRAVCKRAAAAQQLLNCLTEIFFLEAIECAKELDKEYEASGVLAGPLHGLPISLKDQFDYEGKVTTMGWVSKANLRANKDSTLVTLLLDAGAILYCKTNVSMGLMMLDTNNNIWGPTWNPWNRGVNPGGSSGGEGALVSFGGSHLGIGTDIGCTVRTACSFTGLYGLHPSYGRLSYQGLTNTHSSQEAIKPTAGPMCRSPSDIRLLFKSVLDQEPWLVDPQVLPIPWRRHEEILPTKLCFAFGYDPMVQTTPPVTRAMEMTKAALLAAGHEVIEYSVTENTLVTFLCFQLYLGYGGEEFRYETYVSGEPLMPGLQHSFGQLEARPLAEMGELQRMRALLATGWHKRWQDTEDMTTTGRPIDALIMPVCALPAPSYGEPMMQTWGGLSALLDLTTGIFPVTHVDWLHDTVPEDWRPRSELDEQVMKQYKNTKSEDLVNVPIGLSLIGCRLEEEKITAMLMLLEECLGSSQEFFLEDERL